MKKLSFAASLAPPTTPQLTTLISSTTMPITITTMAPTTPKSTSSFVSSSSPIPSSTSPTTSSVTMASSSFPLPSTTVGSTTTGVPPPITTDTTTCDYTGQNFRFALFIDTTASTAGDQINNFLTFFNNLANVPNPAGANRTVVLYSTATGSLNVSGPIQMNDGQTMGQDYQNDISTEVSTVSLVNALNYYNASGDRPNSITSAPTIIMLNDADIIDTTQAKPIINSFRNPANRVAFVISLTFSSTANQALSGLTFDYSKDLTLLTATGIQDTVKEIINFVCLNNHRS